jgi:catechol 2,3-dioxygenase-like lactoylglutathione lyase family enzyme
MNRFRNLLGLGLLVGGALPVAVMAQGAAPAAAPAKPALSPVTGLVPDHAAASVADIEKEAEWYERVLGFKVLNKYNEHVLATQAAENPDFINWHLSIPGYRIDLVQYKGSKRPPRTDPIYLNQGWVHVVFHTDDVALSLKQLQALDVKTDVTWLCANNVHSEKPCPNGVPIQLYIYDPEGNQLEIRRNVVL